MILSDRRRQYSVVRSEVPFFRDFQGNERTPLRSVYRKAVRSYCAKDLFSGKRFSGYDPEARSDRGRWFSRTCQKIIDDVFRKLLRSGRIKSLMVRSTYYIPKKCVIDYLLSDHYKMYQQELKHGIAVSEDRSVKEDTK